MRKMDKQTKVAFAQLFGLIGLMYLGIYGIMHLAVSL